MPSLPALQTLRGSRRIIDAMPSLRETKTNPIATTADDFRQVRQGLELSVDDLIETRHGGERMYVPRKRTKNRISDRQIAMILLGLILAVVIAIVALLVGN